MLRKLIAALCLSALLACPADARMRIPLMGGDLKPYLGMVATRGFVAGQQNGALFYGNSRSFHVAADNISALGIVLGNWRNSTEVVVGIGSATYTASVEYPAHTIIGQIKWSGATSIVLSSGQQILSDIVPLATTIPKGTTFFIRNFQVNPTGILFNSTAASGSPFWPNAGDALEYSSTVIADQTLNAAYTYVNGAGGGPQYPYAIVGRTTKPSVLCIGDSRVQGGGDTPSSGAGAIGELARSIDVSGIAYSNVGASGDSYGSFISGTPGQNGQNINRIALGNYASHIFFNYGVNDVIAAASLPTLQANARTAWALFPGKKIMHITIPPRTASSDGWTTLAGQSAVANFPINGTGVRDSYNAWLLTKPAPLSNVFDVSSIVTSVGNPDLWNVPVAGGGTAVAIQTTDGLHETGPAAAPTGPSYVLIQNSGVINTAAIKR